MKTKRAIQLCAMVFALAALTVLGLSRLVEATEQQFPHLHYVGTVSQPDGSPIPGGWAGGPLTDNNEFLSRLAPPGCYSTLRSMNHSSNRYDLIVGIVDTPACAQAMQTFQPDPSVFPLPVKPGWTFRRR
jgi:hypothetical protein